MIGIAGEWNQNAGYLTSIGFIHGDTLGDGQNSPLWVVPKESENTEAWRKGCGESVYYNKDPSML